MPIDLEDRLRAVMAGRAVGSQPVRRLNVGCGRDRRDGFVNLDISALPEVDVVAALGRSPLPFPDETFDVVLCNDVLEHVDVVPALGEIHRVTARGGAVVISAVHFTSRNLYADPTHVRGFSVRTFDYFSNERTPVDRSYYFDFSFTQVDHALIQFSTLLGRGKFLVWDRVVEPLVNSSRLLQDLYELTFVSRIFPAANVVAVLRK